MICAFADATSNPIMNVARDPEMFQPEVIADTYDEEPESWDVEEPLEVAAP